MSRGIELDIIGDSSYFTRLGKGVSYLVRANGSEYLIDCGATPFLALGHDGLKNLKGLVATHSHEDHRRWFTDMVLYMRYHPDLGKMLRLITAESIHEEFEKNSKGALERTLSADRRRVVSVPYSEFVEKKLLGPRPLYNVQQRPAESGEGQVGRDRQKSGRRGVVWRVVERATGEVLPPARAKVFVDPRANRPRMLFKDPGLDKWVEPETFYPFSSTAFYEAERNDHVDEETGLTFRAIKAAAWHGPPVIGILATLGKTRLAFSSDTVYDPGLWRELVDEERPTPPELGTREFEEASVIEGDINDYIERTWSEERLREGESCFDGAVVVHDADFEHSVVHTPYSKFKPDVDWKRLLLTHTPDGFASTCPITITGRRYRVVEGEVFEVVDGEDLPLEADLYFKDAGNSPWVGYAAADGIARLWEIPRGMTVTLSPGAGADEPPAKDAKLVGRFDAYMDVEGHYLPPIRPPDERYLKRRDGRLELVTDTPEGSQGKIVEDLRRRLHGSAKTKAYRKPEERGRAE